MQAVILAAGSSKRTHPLTINRPKPLLNVLNKTLLEHNLNQLVGLVDEVIIVIGFKKEMIENKFGQSYKKIKIRYVEQKKQLGTGHALMQVEKYVKDRFVVFGADDLFSKIDIKNCLKHKFCVLGRKVKHTQRFGVFLTKNNRLIKIVEKPKKFVSDLANTGFYVFNKEIFTHLKKIKKSKRNEYELTDALQSLADNNEVFCEKVKGVWLSIGYPWDLLNTNEFFINRIKRSDIKGTIEKGVTVKGFLILGKNSVIKSGTYVEGPAVIGEGCVIGPNAYLRAGATIGNNCKVGQAVEIKNTIIMDNSKVPHLSYIGDSIIGENSNLGAGTITANLRHDKENIKSAVSNLLMNTGRRKLGTIIGDNVHTGINTTIYPGRKINQGKTTIPGQIVKKDIL